MKRFIFGFIAILGVLALLVYIGITQSNTNDLLLKYRRQAPFSGHEMTYHYVGKPWFGKGLIFYRPQFPTLPLHLSLDRIKVVFSPLERNISLSGLTIQIAKTLQDRNDLLISLKSFQGPNDFLTKPLEGLALLGIDTFKGDVHIHFLKQQDLTYLSIQFFQRKKLILEIKTTFSSPLNPELWGWIATPIQKGTITLFSPNILDKVDFYYRSLGQESPLPLKRALSQKEPLTLTFNLKNPQTISSFLKGLP